MCVRVTCTVQVCNVALLTDTQRILLLENQQLSLQHTAMLRLVVLSQEEQLMEMQTLICVTNIVHIQTKTTPVGGEWTWVQVTHQSMKYT